MVIIDELSVNYDDRKKLKDGKTSEMEKSLTWLRHNTDMTLAALSTTLLLDRINFYVAEVSQTMLDEMIAKTGFSAVSLKHIMRTSHNIATATTPASVSASQTGHVKIPETISPGSSSTVPGNRPKAWVYKDTNDLDYHKKLAGFVTRHLKTLDTKHLKCVVLTGGNVSARELSSELRERNIHVSCYDNGVDVFDLTGVPEYREGIAGVGGQAELAAWLSAEGGVLVTSERFFRGAEADSVIYITRDWGYFFGIRSIMKIPSIRTITSIRSPMTRAVAGLLLITSDLYLNVQELRKHWEVEILEEGAGELDRRQWILMSGVSFLWHFSRLWVSSVRFCMSSFWIKHIFGILVLIIIGQGIMQICYNGK